MIWRATNLEGRSFWRELGFRGKVLVCQNVLMVFYTKDYDHFTHFHFLLKFATQKVKIPSLKDYCLLVVSKDSFCLSKDSFCLSKGTFVMLQFCF